MGSTTLSYMMVVSAATCSSAMRIARVHRLPRTSAHQVGPPCMDGATDTPANTAATWLNCTRVHSAWRYTRIDPPKAEMTTSTLCARITDMVRGGESRACAGLVFFKRREPRHRLSAGRPSSQLPNRARGEPNNVGGSGEDCGQLWD